MARFVVFRKRGKYSWRLLADNNTMIASSGAGYTSVLNCIRGMRVTAGIIVGQVGAGDSVEEILADYP